MHTINEDDMAQDRRESMQEYRGRLLRQIANGNISDMDNHDRVHGALAYIDAIRGEYEGSARNINVVVAGRGEQGSAKIGFVLHGINPKGTHIVAQPAAKGAARHPRHEEVPIKNIYGLQLSSYPNLRPEHRETLRRLMDFRRLTEMFEPLRQLLAEAKKEKKPYKGFKKGKNHPEGGLSRAEAKRQGIHAGIETKEEAKRKGGFNKLSGKTKKRRKSFCARMCGMKRRRTSAKTARDPKSKINAALRVWGCKCGSSGKKQLKESFIQMILEKKKMKNPCWKGYEMVGTKKKGGRKVPNCVPANESTLNTIQMKVKERFLSEGCGCGGGNQPKPKPRPRPKPKQNITEEVVNSDHKGRMTDSMIRSRDKRRKKLKGKARVVKKGDTKENAEYRLATYIEWLKHGKKSKKGKKEKTKKTK